MLIARLASWIISPQLFDDGHDAGCFWLIVKERRGVRFRRECQSTGCADVRRSAVEGCLEARLGRRLAVVAAA